MTVSSTRPYQRQFRRWGVVGAVVWMVFLVPVVLAAWRTGGVRGGLALALLAAFAVVYVYVVGWGRARQGRWSPGGALRSESTRSPTNWHLHPRQAATIYGVLAILAAAVAVTLPGDGLACGVYLSVAGVMLFSTRVAAVQCLVLTVGLELVTRLVPAWGGATGIGLSVFLATFAVWGISQAMRRSWDLVQAQEENSELLVAQERTRMARDLHDILGHSLTVITVKSELAGRLLETHGLQARERVRAEIADIERLSRDALADVRRTVEGYRDLSLPVELTRARVALEAAGITSTIPGSTDEVPSQWRELFAWTVREGVTNVVRHSAAQHCTISLAPDRVTVADDGRGSSKAAADGGHGLIGLRERATVAGARIVVEAPTAGGFSLAVVVPSTPPKPPLPSAPAVSSTPEDEAPDPASDVREEAVR